MNYKLINNVVGWFSFLIAAVVYLMTIEPTASFWDCGEFIATAYKLEVGHPPGAPLFMILGRFFSLFAGGDVTKVAMMVNAMSALMSAFTILFLFWTITHFAKKMIAKTSEELNKANIIAIMGSGLIGALAYTFSDTFWFSAVEGEVYATSSFFTAIAFWAIIKWENAADEPYANRWLVLIAFLMGLSIGVHLLNLLTIPAIVFIYYFKKYTVTRNGIIKAFAVSIIILGAIQYGIIPGIVTTASWFELLFVNSFGLPFKTGVLVYAILLIAAIVWGIYYTHLKKKVLLNTIMLCFAVILIGYSSFTMIVIRSLANPPMDENNPENVFALLAYLNREQYGDRPLFYGHYYNAPLDNENPYEETDPVYIQKVEKIVKGGDTTYVDKYVVADYKEKPNYDSRFKSIFPRMFSSESSHISAYKEWADIKGTPIKVVGRDGKAETIYKPSFFENLVFFVKYQVGHMYFRYFMWNFAGRQNDIQGHGGILKGNWISGIPFIDEMRLGDQDKLPKTMTNNKAMNKFYLLPLILGIVGLMYQYKNGKRDFWVTVLLFFFTGLAIVIYLNQYPYQPRERDYAYAGSFYAFAIWIGLGVLGIYNLMKKRIPMLVSASAATALSLGVPALMAAEGWDDHDRSNRYTARDFAENYLNSCEPNAILFTNGDNDTFPLWYAQEVEGIRTDIKVVNLSLFNTDWYIDQMRRKSYDADPIPISMHPDKYIQGTRDVVYLFNEQKFDNVYTPLKDVLQWVSSDDPRTKLPQAPDINFSPTRNFRLPVDTLKAINNGTVKPKNSNLVLKNIDWKLNKSYILKSELMVLDLLSTNNWNRPIYFAITVGSDSYAKLENFFQLEGLAYRLVPIKTTSSEGQIGRIDTDILYENLINKFKWGGINNPKVYLDENNLRMTMNLRNNFARLAEELLKEGKRDSAIKVLDKCIEVMPNETVPYNYFNLGIAEAYYKADEIQKANQIISVLSESTLDEIQYYFSLKDEFLNNIDYELRRAMMVLQELVRMTKMHKQQDNFNDLDKRFEELQTIYFQRVKE
jgi:hypothetical protein